LPRELQNDIPYAAVVLRTSKSPDVARAFVSFLISAQGLAAFRAAGFVAPGSQK
jgi:ABC-type molybdate transport system substrate-binding protein